MSVPLAAPGAENETLAEEISGAIERVRTSGIYVLGPEVEAFEREFAATVGIEHAVGVASGTDALMLALAAHGIGPGDEVITTAMTAGATAAAILLTGATPVLADVDAGTLMIDPAAAAAAVTPRTKAIVPVHLYGGSADLAALRELTRSRGLLLIEDCAQAVGTLFDGAHVGAGSDAASFSFYPTKNLAAIGDGGALLTNSPDVAERARELRQYGWRTPQLSESLGWNSRLDEIQAAVLRVKLAHLGELLAARRERAARYTAALDSRAAAAGPLAVDPRVRHSFHLYVIRSRSRDELAAHLAECGILTGVHYRVPLHLQPAYAKTAIAGELPAAELAATEILSLPLYVGLTAEQQDSVLEAVNSFQGGAEDG